MTNTKNRRRSIELTRRGLGRRLRRAFYRDLSAATRRKRIKRDGGGIPRFCFGFRKFAIVNPAYLNLRATVRAYLARTSENCASRTWEKYIRGAAIYARGDIRRGASKMEGRAINLSSPPTATITYARAITRPPFRFDPRFSLPAERIARPSLLYLAFRRPSERAESTALLRPARH